MKINTFLQKLGIKGYDELSPQERQTYDQYQQLMEREVTLDDLKKMIPTLISMLDEQLLNPENSKETDLFLKARIKNLRDLNAFITLPERNRKALQATFESLLKIKS